MPLHVLVIPSEPYLPEPGSLWGIFQGHQAHALTRAGAARMGVLSVELARSVPGTLRGALRALGRGAPGETTGALLSELWGRLRVAPPYLRYDRIDGLPVVRGRGIYLLPASSAHDHLSWLWTGWAAYEAYVRRYGVPDVIHAHNALYAGLLAGYLRRGRGVPYLLTEHSTAYQRGVVSSALLELVRVAVGGAARHHVVSPALGDALAECLGPVATRAEFVPNVLPPSFHRDPGAALDHTGRPPPDAGAPFTFLNVGALRPVKGHDLLLPAFAERFAGRPAYRLRIVGEGNERERLAAMIDDLGLAGQVTLVGQLDSDAVRQEILACDALVCSSRIETFGVVLIEALACGRPVVSTDCGGPAAIVDDTVGRLVAPGRAQALAEGLAWAADHARDFDPDELRRLALARYGGASFAARIGETYRAIARERSLPA